MKTDDRRIALRLRVQFRTTFCAAHTLEGSGIILDISMGGCRVESSVPVTPGISLELRIHASNLEWPLMIEEASVRWVSAQTFGLAFNKINETEQQRLDKVIQSVAGKDVHNGSNE